VVSELTIVVDCPSNYADNEVKVVGGGTAPAQQRAVTDGVEMRGLHQRHDTGKMLAALEKPLH
jgi:hypothetical protein